eukprot:gene27870-33655_t
MGGMNDYIGLPSTLCDLNRDGYPEVVISAEGIANPNVVRVLYGGANVGIRDYDLTLLPSDPSSGFILTLSTSLDTLSGADVACGDVNGDGINDLMLTTRRTIMFTATERSFYVLYGRTTPFPASFALDSAAAEAEQGFAITVTTEEIARSGLLQTVHIADVNKDDIGDMIFQTWDSSGLCINNTWATVILFGSRNTRTSLDFSVGLATTTVPATDFMYLCSSYNDGLATYATGDINNDGDVDLVLGVPNEYGFAGLHEYVYVVFGPLSSKNGLSLTTGLTGSNGFEIIHEAILTDTWPFAGLFASTIAVTDINEDSFDDIIIGAPLMDSVRGRVFIVFGKASGFAASHTLGSPHSDPGFTTTEIINGVVIHAGFGYRVAAIGDINQDGVKDFAVNLSGNYGGNADSTFVRGIVLVYFGRRSAWPSSIDIPQSFAAAQSMPSTEGFCVAGVSFGVTSTSFGLHIAAGDVNNDGAADLLVGAPQYSTSPERDLTTTTNIFAGAVYILQGPLSTFQDMDINPYAPAVSPSETPTQSPTISSLPTVEPVDLPTAVPSLRASQPPSQLPSVVPTLLPSVEASQSPSQLPSVVPTVVLSVEPSQPPSQLPSVPSKSPSQPPSQLPSVYRVWSQASRPASRPAIPSVEPSKSPSQPPSQLPSVYR